MSSRDFEAECSQKLFGSIWDNTWNEDYQESITLSIREMREIANRLRSVDQRAQQVPLAHSEKAEAIWLE